MATFTQDWFTRHIPNWDLWLDRFRGQPDLQFLEVGAYEGRSSLWLLQTILKHPTSKLTVVDIWSGPFLAARARFEKNLAPFKQQLEQRVGSSVAILPKMVLNKRQFDVIYIDGDHCPETAWLDGCCAMQLLKRDGLLIFDDYELRTPGHHQPGPAIDRLWDLFQDRLVPVSKGYQMCWQKIR
jgi:predicted O-methyltransferase YrrM